MWQYYLTFHKDGIRLLLGMVIRKQGRYCDAIATQEALELLPALTGDDTWVVSASRKGFFCNANGEKAQILKWEAD